METYLSENNYFYHFFLTNYFYQLKSQISFAPKKKRVKSHRFYDKFHY